MTGHTFDPVWEQELYSKGLQVTRYPYDSVVTFVFRNAPRNKAREQVRILEVGCGAANNLWFAAREGFSVFGVDGSESAIRIARERFERDGLRGDLRVGDFTHLPFEDEFFDLVIDRGALVCCGRSAGARAVREIRRVTRTRGRFFFNPYSDRHSSAASGRSGPDGLRLDITEGLVGVGQLCFYGRQDVEDALRDWRTLSLQHVSIEEMLGDRGLVHAEWRAVAERPEVTP